MVSSKIGFVYIFHFLGGTNHIRFQQQQDSQAWFINGLNNMYLSNKINNINNIKAITQERIYQWIKRHVSVWSQHRHQWLRILVCFLHGNYCFGLWYGHLCAEPPVPWWSYGDICLEYHFDKDMYWSELRCCSWPGVKQYLRIDIMIYYASNTSNKLFQSLWPVLEWTLSSLFQLIHHLWFWRTWYRFCWI